MITLWLDIHTCSCIYIYCWAKACRSKTNARLIDHAICIYSAEGASPPYPKRDSCKSPRANFTKLSYETDLFALGFLQLPLGGGALALCTVFLP